VCGIPWTKKIITSTNSVLKENCYFMRENVVNTPLINPEKVYLSSLYRKPGLIKISSRGCFKIALNLLI
jgi:hypothetical protein